MTTSTGLVVVTLALVMCAEAQKYNLGEVLRKSILFYEAQRSGKLPASNRIPWRGDSALQDGSDVGIDLTGGWYDAGDHVKFNFPGAATVTMLTWGMVRYKAAYQSVKEWENALDCIKWELDYFIKCHTEPNELYMQVGNGTADHKFWGRPEDMTMARPSYKITADLPGSDLAGETAAAMASGYLAFNESNAEYAALLLRHAKELYTFANTYRGKYSDSVPQEKPFYRSSNYGDELALAAIWLYKATGEASYLQQAKEHIASVPVHHEFSWDTKTIGAALLIYEADSTDTNSKGKIEFFVDKWLNKVKRTPKGLAWYIKWGANRYSANAAFGMLVAADLGFETAACRQFAEQQINYILGDNGRSYVCGFGNNPPVRPHHRSSSCPLMPAPCSWRQFNSPAPNPQVLYGALAGGPDENDFYEDKRNDYIKNEVAVVYNSGFQSAVAGLLARSMQ